MKIKKDELKKFKGDSEFFSGDVNVTILFDVDVNRPYSGAIVEFDKRARTAWHTHFGSGQQIICTKGCGITEFEDGEVIEFDEGDVVLCPANRPHYHGAQRMIAL